MNPNAQHLGKYELQELLGQGGMAEVRKALDTQLRRHVAIKFLRADFQSDPNFITRFEREAQVIASLHHPNIVRIYDFHVSQPTESDEFLCYMVMEYIEGQTLAHYIRKTSHLKEFPPANEILHLFTSVSKAIDYAHQKSMLHRDIKPSNILLDTQSSKHASGESYVMGEPILSDFGIVKLLGAPSSTLTNAWLGTPHYISPELIMGHPGDERSDIYSLGVILYEVCTGIFPFTGENVHSIMMQHVYSMPTPPVLVNPNISPPLSAVILRSLAKDPRARFSSASDFALALTEALTNTHTKDLNRTYLTDKALNASASNIPPHLTPPFSNALSSPPHPDAMPASQDISLSENGQSPPLTPPSGPAHSSLLTDSRPDMLLFEHVAPIPSSPSSANISPVPRNSGCSVDGQATVLMPGTHSSFIEDAKSSRSWLKSLTSSSSPGTKRLERWRIALVSLLIILVAGASLSALFLFPQKPSLPAAPSSQISGRAFFVNSGQISELNNRGINDELEIDLQNVRVPPPDKSYYAWLEPDKGMNMVKPIFLGTLQVNREEVHFLYPGDQQHTNLLESMSRFLITEEEANSSPAIPSPDTSTWRYYAEIPQPAAPDANSNMNSMSNLSVLAHIRHLLAESPELKKVGLLGGLDTWLFRNTQKILEWSASARDEWQSNEIPLMYRQIVRILDYLDGASFVQRDAPNVPIMAVPRLSQIGLLDLSQQLAPSLLYLIDFHLNALTQSLNFTVEQRALASQIDRAVKNIISWLNKVRQDAIQLVKLSFSQLAQPSSLPILDDMATQALNAFSGRENPSTGTIEGGVIQVHYTIQHLATLNIKSYNG